MPGATETSGYEYREEYHQFPFYGAFATLMVLIFLYHIATSSTTLIK